MSSNTIAIVEMLSLLTHGDAISVKQIHEQTGLSNSAIYRYFKFLKRRNLIRIAEYKRTAGPYVPFYEWNPEEKYDAKRPVGLTQKERSRNCRIRRTQFTLTPNKSRERLG